MKRNFGNPSQSLPVTHSTQRRPTGETFESRPSYSDDLAEMVSGGFLIAFAIACGSLFGAITFFASLLIEPSSNTQFVQYDRHVQADR